MNPVKPGLVRASLNACESLANKIAAMNLNDLASNPSLIESTKKQLVEENNQLKQEIEATKSKLEDLSSKLPKQDYNEQLPLKTPEVKSTTRLVGDALLKSNQQNDDAKAVNVDGKKEPKAPAKPKESAKPKGGKAAAKEPENDKIDSSRLNLLVGKVVEVNKHPDAEKLYVEKIDLGEEQPRTVVSGLVDYIDVDKFQNKLVVVLCNLKPSKLRGVLSEAMVMCASDKENNKVELLEPPASSVPGDRIVFDKYPGEPDQQLNAKKKIWEQVSVDLKTDENKVACYKGDPFKVKDKGNVTAPTLANTLIR